MRVTPELEVQQFRCMTVLHVPYFLYLDVEDSCCHLICANFTNSYIRLGRVLSWYDFIRIEGVKNFLACHAVRHTPHQIDWYANILCAVLELLLFSRLCVSLCTPDLSGIPLVQQT